MSKDQTRGSGVTIPFGARLLRAHQMREPLVVLIILSALGCGLVQPPPTPDPAILGCYRLDTNLPTSYVDSLGYGLPDRLELGYTREGQWTVRPTDIEWHPSWTIYDGLPSGIARRVRGRHTASVLQADSVLRIPGDSIDVISPAAIGRLVLRVGGNPEHLGGRAEWVHTTDQSYLNEGRWVELRRANCEGLPNALKRK